MYQQATGYSTPFRNTGEINKTHLDKHFLSNVVRLYEHTF